MKHLLILAALAILLALALAGAGASGQESPLSPLPPPRPTLPQPQPTPDPLMDEMAGCWYLCKVELGYTGGEKLVECYKACMAAPPDPTPTPEAREYVGLWWRSPDAACELWRVGDGYVLACP